MEYHSGSNQAVISNKLSAKRKAYMKFRARLLPELYDTKSYYQLIITITKQAGEDDGDNFFIAGSAQLFFNSCTTCARLTTRTTVQLRTILLMMKSGLLITNQIREICNSYD